MPNKDKWPNINDSGVGWTEEEKKLACSDAPGALFALPNFKYSISWWVRATAWIHLPTTAFQAGGPLLSLPSMPTLSFITLQTHFVTEEVKKNLENKEQVQVHLAFPESPRREKNLLALNSQSALPEILGGYFSLHTLDCPISNLCLISLERGGNCFFVTFG